MALIADYLTSIYSIPTPPSMMSSPPGSLPKPNGALYLVYGFNRILPRYDHLQVVIPDLGSEGIAALYRKQ